MLLNAELESAQSLLRAQPRLGGVRRAPPAPSAAGDA